MSFTPSGYFNLRLPAISDALNVQNEQAKPTISGFLFFVSSAIVSPHLSKLLSSHPMVAFAITYEL
jgi:hypothetical protein